MSEENLEQQNLGAETTDINGQVAVAEGGDSNVDQVQETLYEIDGEKIPVSQIKQWKSGHLMQSDYTKKTQELAKERERFAPYQQLETYLQSNPDKAQQVYSILSGQQQAANQEEVDPVMQKMSALERQVNILVGETSKQKVDKMIDEINADEKYAGLFKNDKFEKLLLSTAMQTGKTNKLREVADEIHELISGLKADSKLETEKNVIKNLNSATRQTPSGKGTMGAPKGFDASGSSWSDLDKKALEMF